MRNSNIRISNTELGTVWIDCYRSDALSLSPWWHGTCRLAGERLPFFRVLLCRVEGRWTFDNMVDGSEHDPNLPKWPRGARQKVPAIALEIGAAWAAANESLLIERGTEWLNWEVESTLRSEKGAAAPARGVTEVCRNGRRTTSRGHHPQRGREISAVRSGYLDELDLGAIVGPG